DALAAAASAESSFGTYSPNRWKDNSRNTTLGEAHSWANAGSLPKWLQLDFGTCTSVDRVALFTTRGFEIQDYDPEWYDGSHWVTLVTVTANTSGHRVHTFSPISTDKWR